MRFVRIPYGWFEKNGVWWRLTSEQRGALASLCSLVTYSDFEYETKYGKVPLKSGQMVTSVRKLADILGISESKVRTLLKKLKEEDVISVQSVRDVISGSLAGSLASAIAQSTILTINKLQATADYTLSGTLDLTLAQEINNNKYINKNNNSGENNTQVREKESSIVIIDEDRIPTKDYDTIKVDEMMNFVRFHKQEWIEKFCMNNHLTIEQFYGLYADFVRHCENHGETVKVVKDATNHFANWYLIQKDKKMNHGTTSQNNSQRTSGYSRTPEEAERRRKFEEHIRQQLNNSGRRNEKPLPF